MFVVYLSCVFVAHSVCDWAGLTVRDLLLLLTVPKKKEKEKKKKKHFFFEKKEK